MSTRDLRYSTPPRLLRLRTQSPSPGLEGLQCATDTWTKTCFTKPPQNTAPKSKPNF